MLLLPQGLSLSVNYIRKNSELLQISLSYFFESFYLPYFSLIRFNSFSAFALFLYLLRHPPINSPPLNEPTDQYPGSIWNTFRGIIPSSPAYRIYSFAVHNRCYHFYSIFALKVGLCVIYPPPLNR